LLSMSALVTVMLSGSPAEPMLAPAAWCQLAEERKIGAEIRDATIKGRMR